MARRSHYSFNKRQKELRQKEKAEKKTQRRLARRQESSGETTPENEALDPQNAESTMIAGRSTNPPNDETSLKIENPAESSRADGIVRGTKDALDGK